MEHESLESQVDRLAKFIMADVPGEPSQNEGAIDTAIRIIKTHLHIPPDPPAPGPTDADERVMEREFLDLWTTVLMKSQDYAWNRDDDSVLGRIRSRLADYDALKVEVEGWRILRKTHEKAARELAVGIIEAEAEMERAGERLENAESTKAGAGCGPPRKASPPAESSELHDYKVGDESAQSQTGPGLSSPGPADADEITTEQMLGLLDEWSPGETRPGKWKIWEAIRARLAAPRVSATAADNKTLMRLAQDLGIPFSAAKIIYDKAWREVEAPRVSEEDILEWVDALDTQPEYEAVHGRNRTARERFGPPLRDLLRSIGVVVAERGEKGG